MANSKVPPEPTLFLDGQLLVAMPGMSDPRFDHAVIYICAHSSDGAMGIRINQAPPKLTFHDVLARLDIVASDESVIPAPVGDTRVLNGGPVETGRGFVLHSSDYINDASTLVIDDGVCLTATLDILRDMVDGAGPHQAVLALGYAGWGPGQLEREIKANGWLNCPAAPDLLFSPQLDEIYGRALARIGVDAALLSSAAGHA